MVKVVIKIERMIMMFVKESDKVRCSSIVLNEIETLDLQVLKNFIKEISEEILNISYSKGGDYTESMLSAFAAGYFGKEMYKKYL
ncbi:MAG: hypothetical protein JEZ08_24840 [Clostridiales bacterium]|nr:hypothetical protein [Clostridiales bacterium]